VMLGRLVNEVMKHAFKDDTHYAYARKLIGVKSGIRLGEGEGVSWEYPWGDTLKLFKNVDCRIINLETSVTTWEHKYPNKVFNYRMHPGNIEALKAANVDYCSLANNHIIDYGMAGMNDTVLTLKAAGINFAGAGTNLEAAMRPALLSVRGKTFAIFSFSDHGCCEYKDGHRDMWAAEKDQPGFNFIDVDNYKFSEDPLNLRTVLTAPKRDKQADAVIFSVHWGPNYAWMPSDAIVRLAHFLIDECGVDIIHGHSAHHIQGIEIYKGKPIIYGCGDFVDDYAVDEHYRNDNGMAYVVNLDPATLALHSLHLYPTVIDGFQAKLAKGESYEWIVNTMQRLCHKLKTKVEENKQARRLEVML
jgi:poly-gamma-glutamate capsule biosynthesis protein CapA/YwtB (metallophosphatase superfamily)